MNRCKYTFIAICLLILYTNSYADVQVSIKAVDDKRNLISYVTILGFLSPIKSPLQLTEHDLAFVANRYFNSHEFILPITSNKVLPNIIVFPMSGKDGKIDLNMDYQYFEGRNAKIPEEFVIGFALLKYGYKPEIISFNTSNTESFSKTLVLQRTKDIQRYSTKSEQEFNQLRYELSDFDKNIQMTESNLIRIKKIKTKLKQLGENLEGINNKLAARVYARLQYMPTLKIRNENIVGFKRANPNSKESLAFLAKAYKLDPTNPYIASNFLFRLGNKFGGRKYIPKTADPATKKSFSNFFNRLKILMESNGEEIWPQYHKLYANWHRKLDGDYSKEKGRLLLDKLYKTTPKYSTRKKLFWLLNRK